ncbi:MAG: glycogen debranching enzyme N-terminal domain-containing protein [Candidatus Altiarchaeota archaeon]|nr:glycogen debranching enzyme N-terminal domain-containing protein [Candidatus Altiarchaeota archaeon]
MSVGSWRKVDLSFRPRDLGLEACLSREWVLSNGLGGYSSSTLALMNTRKYHGLLVSSDNNLNRFMCLQKLDEEVTVGQNKAELSVNEFKDALKPSGLDYLDGFSFDLESVSLKYVVSGVEVLKTVRMARGRNAVIVSYAINNTQDSPVSMKVKSGIL